MVFFTAIIIVFILYYLQADGLVYVTIIALVAELINIFMTHTMTISVEKRLKAQHKKIIDGYTKRLKTSRKTIQALEKVQEDSVRILYNSNMKIKDLEEKLEKLTPPQTPAKEKEPTLAKEEKPPLSKEIKKPEVYMDLPDGSNRNRSKK
ncbi:MAG: hypothetical protein KKF12_15005 [Proteobacteria bacterium]|nr:hypothetical protein [Desulfobacula sp.]MBU3952329.1 hypothetical protein [Pseudomonadota bacterium]MBU4132121.1 hypothetical protein [Pseudomonadota bacterium]